MKVFLPPKLEVRGDTVCVNTVGGRHAPQAGGPWRIVTHGALCRDHKRARGCGAARRSGAARRRRRPRWEAIGLFSDRDLIEQCSCTLFAVRSVLCDRFRPLARATDRPLGVAPCISTYT
mgnify:CR=1 FL=1